MHTESWIDQATFDNDVHYLEARWQRVPIGNLDLPLIDIGAGDPLVCVPILEHLEFVYARQMRYLSQSRRVLLYRRREVRTRPCGMEERIEELRTVLDSLGLMRVDLLGHGDAAMVAMEFAIRYPQRCRALIVIAQGADYRIAPHPWIWFLHELFLRLPVEHLLPSWLLRRIVINYIMTHAPDNHTTPALPRRLIETQFSRIRQWSSVYKFSVLPIIHNFDIKDRVQMLTMPVLLVNRADDALSPVTKTAWLAQHIPLCAGHYIVAGRERFFPYTQDEAVTPLIATFLSHLQADVSKPSSISTE